MNIPSQSKESSLADKVVEKMKSNGGYDKFKKTCLEYAATLPEYGELQQAITDLVKDDLALDQSKESVDNLRIEVKNSYSVQAKIGTLLRACMTTERVNQLLYPHVLNTTYQVMNLPAPSNAQIGGINDETDSRADTPVQDEELVQVDEGADLQVASDDNQSEEMEMSEESADENTDFLLDNGNRDVKLEADNREYTEQTTATEEDTSTSQSTLDISMPRQHNIQVARQLAAADQFIQDHIKQEPIDNDSTLDTQQNEQLEENLNSGEKMSSDEKEDSTEEHDLVMRHDQEAINTKTELVDDDDGNGEDGEETEVQPEFVPDLVPTTSTSSNEPGPSTNEQPPIDQSAENDSHPNQSDASESVQKMQGQIRSAKVSNQRGAGIKRECEDEQLSEAVVSSFSPRQTRKRARQPSPVPDEPTANEDGLRAEDRMIVMLQQADVQVTSPSPGSGTGTQDGTVSESSQEPEPDYDSADSRRSSKRSRRTAKPNKNKDFVYDH